VNNAGATMWARFDEIEDVEVLQRIMQVNYMGAVYCTRHALRYLKVAKGRLVGISSLAGRTGVPTRTGYAASKHAMTGFFAQTGPDASVFFLHPEGTEQTRRLALLDWRAP